ncbi:MAG: preprotein translocase subunit YajC [Clostridiales bacterium]|nr:preprotein translocase subunit YajC [Clostridiales bacterium]
MWIILALLVVVMIVMPMFSNRKRQKEVNEMLDTINVGDEIMTIGGIMGKVVELKTHESGEKLMVIETGEGNNKMTMTFTIQALRLNYTKTKHRQEQLAKEKATKEGKNGGAEKSDLKLEEVKPDEVQEVEEAQNNESEN